MFIFVYLYICICVIETDLSERLCGSNQPTFSEALPKADPWEISGFVLLIDRTFVKVLQSRLFLEGMKTRALIFLNKKSFDCTRGLRCDKSRSSLEM